LEDVGEHGGIRAAHTQRNRAECVPSVAITIHTKDKSIKSLEKLEAEGDLFELGEEKNALDCKRQAEKSCWR
jgi:hypothetical protein